MSNPENSDIFSINMFMHKYVYACPVQVQFMFRLHLSLVQNCTTLICHVITAGKRVHSGKNKINLKYSMEY